MKLSNFITERLKITSKTKSADILKPTTRQELLSLIDEELEKQGPDADLNHIDTSGIDDMQYLFHNTKIRNIKIDKWDVSNVIYMSAMFTGCTEFNCDLSNWDVSKVKSHEDMFKLCTKMKKHPEFQPNFKN